MSFHSEHTRPSLRPQITFKDIKITHQSELRFLGIYIMEHLTWGARARSLRTEPCRVVYMMKILKETVSPCVIRNIYYLNFHSCMALYYGVGIVKVIQFLNCKRRPFE
jgi:hypothetical protein